MVTLTDLIISSPILILTVGLLIVMLTEVFAGPNWPRLEVTLVIFIGALVAAISTASMYDSGNSAYGGFLRADPFSLFFTVLVSAGSILTLLIGANRLGDERVESKGDYYALLIASSIGAILFASSGELITMFVSLEIMSMALYCLCGSAISLKVSTESALKYFLLGSFSSAFLLYGMAIIYGVTGSTEISEINSYVTTMEPSALLYAGIGLMLVGFSFKIGAVPFHFWAPDVYQGAPSSVTAYMACVVKASAVAALLRGMWTMFSDPEVFAAWSDAVWVMAFLTMSLGNLAALRQRSVKRMLAYSSIAHVGYVLVAFLAPDSGGGAAILFYLIAYTAMTLGAFGVVVAVTSKFAAERDADNLSRFRGLGWSNPALGVLMALFMFSLAGLPPGLGGLFGKFYLFNAAIKANFIGIVIIGVINSAISCYYYLRVLSVMYFETAEGEELKTTAPLGFPLSSALAVCALLVVGLGIFSSQIYSLAAWAAESILI